MLAAVAIAYFPSASLIIRRIVAASQYLMKEY